MAVDESERIRRLRIKVKATGRSVSVEKTLTVLFYFKEADTMTQQYQELTEQLAALVDAKWPMISNLANAAALLYEKLDRLNWAGFYLTDNHVLWLGPFQGKTACVRIAEGKGVCGTALQTDSVQRVEDVHKFPGHIACDAASRSEIVLPIHKNGEVIGVLDIDSPEVGRFSAEDEEGLREVVRILERIIVCS